MDKFWERYITSRPAPGESKGAFEAFAAAHKEPRITAQEPRNMAEGGRIGYGDGQLVRNTVDGSRPGYNGKRVYLSPDIDKFSDALLDAYATDDITKIIESGKSKKFANVITAVKSGKDKSAKLAKVIKNTSLDEETIFNLLDDRDAYIDLAREGHGGAPPRQLDFYKKAENWIIKNSSRYSDPDKFKKAFIRTFGKNNDLIKTMKRLDVGERRKQTSVPFSSWFKETILGTQQKFSQPSYNYNQLNNIFKTAIYTNNEKVRNNITKEIKKLLDMPMAKGGKFDIRDEIANNKIFKQFGFDRQIRGPIARLLANEITKSVIIPGSGEEVLKQIGAFRDPYLGTSEIIRYLRERVDPKYKNMFDETAKAVDLATKQKWPEAKKALNIADNIMWDHKIPKELVKLGYADQIEYIKLNPTSKEFNARIKNPQFDQKIIKLAHDWKKATTVDAKAKIVGDMNILKDKFSKKYGNYLDDVKITPDKTGKPIFSSTADVVTKKTNLIKSLTTSLAQEKGHKTFAELYASKDGRKQLKAMTSLTGINDYLRANGMGPICVTKSPKKCGMDLIKSEGGVEAYRSELEKRMSNAKGDEKWFKAYNNPKLDSVKNFFKGAGKKLWKLGKAGVIGELYYIPLGTAYESGRGKNLLEALDNSIGLGGHFGMEEKNLMKYADKAGYSEEDKNFFKQFSQLEKNDNWMMFWEMAAAGDKWATEKIGKYYPGVPLWSLQEHAAGKVKDLQTESDNIMGELYTGLGEEGLFGKFGEREYLKDVQAIDWINKAKEKEANTIINKALAEKHGEPSLAPWTPAPDRWLVMDNLINAFTKKGREKIRKEGLAKEQAGPLWSMLTSPIGAAYAAGDKRIDREKYLEEAGREDLLHKEYMHPLYGASFSYPQAVGVGRYASGGLANLTRTVAPDSGPMSQGLRSLYINDRDY